MALEHETKKSDDVRAPAVPRGKAVIITRYRQDVAKVALINPEDLAMLEQSHDLLQSLGELEPSPLSSIALKAMRAEDRPRSSARIENAEKIAAILGL
jgi:hypothetical protein